MVDFVFWIAGSILEYPKHKFDHFTDFRPTHIRVAKCHGYGGYIRVKKLKGWGKKSGRIYSYAKSSIVLGKEQLI